MIFIITILALWTYPIITLIIVLLTNNRLRLRQIIVKVSIGLMILTILGLYFNFSTTSKISDWIFVTSIYFCISLLLWVVIWQKSLIVKIFTGITMVIIFGIGYFSGTVGALGVGFIVGAYEPCAEKWLKNGLIYKEIGIGNAISHIRGKRIEIFRTIPWCPLIEWEIASKDYYNINLYCNPIIVEYNQTRNILYFRTTEFNQKEQKYITWSDSILLK